VAPLAGSLTRLAEARSWLQALTRRFAELSNTSAPATFLQLSVLLPLLGLALSGLGLLLAWWISRVIIEPVARLTRMTTRLSRGELELLEEGEQVLDLEVDTQDEIALLLRSTLDMARSMQQMVAMAVGLPAHIQQVLHQPGHPVHAAGQALQGTLHTRIQPRPRLLASQVNEAPRGRILRVTPDGQLTPLVSSLPSLGDHHTNGPAIGPDGSLYFSVGTATNSGVVGPRPRHQQQAPARRRHAPADPQGHGRHARLPRGAPVRGPGGRDRRLPQ
jgi:hypothetical protein